MLVKIATIGKMPYPKLLSGKVSLGNLPENRSSAEVRAKKGGPDAQGRLQCRKWREF